ncbi:hypothetical protein D3C87_1713570 [compost metagenome]
MRLGGVHVIDAQIEGWANFELGQHAKRGHAACRVHQRCQGTAVNDACLWVADDLRAVRQHHREPFGTGAVNPQAEYLTMPQRR